MICTDLSVLPGSAVLVLEQHSTVSWGLRLPEGNDQMYPGWLCCCLLVCLSNMW